MTGRDLLREVAESLSANRLRATLAMTGIIAGVATIVAALAVGDGSRRQAMADIGALGTDNVIVRAHERTGAKDVRLAPLLWLSDARTFQTRFPGSRVSALRLVQDSVANGPQAVGAAVAGVTSDWRAATNADVARGRWFAPTDAQRECAIVGDSLASALFGTSDPMGQRVLAVGEWRTIIGVLATAAHGLRSSLQHPSPDDTLFVPFETLDVSLGSGDRGDAATEIVIRLPGGDDPSLAAKEVSRLLADRRDGGDPAYDLVVPRELLEARLRAERSSHVLVLSIGLLALLISGIGIMNIMVASVTERTQEVGVRRAVGASRRSVLMQFAGEAAALGVAGGAIGLPAGALAAWASARLAGWPVAISGSTVAFALTLALAVALMAGIYPARLAASISPIDALRE